MLLAIDVACKFTTCDDMCDSLRHTCFMSFCYLFRSCVRCCAIVVVVVVFAHYVCLTWLVAANSFCAQTETNIFCDNK